MRDVDRRRVRRFVREVGAPPDCLGHYLAGHPECDGDLPCGWRAGCRAFLLHCSAFGLDPQVYKAALAPRTVIEMTFDLLRRDGAVPVQPRIRRGWERFRDSIAEALPAGIVIQPGRELAAPWELYEGAWRDTRHATADLPRAFLLRVRNEYPRASEDFPVARYWPRFRTRIEPTIELRAELQGIRDRFPQIGAWAMRWTAGGGRRIGASAVRVRSERIEDVGRLLVRLLADGQIRNLGIQGTRIVYTGGR